MYEESLQPAQTSPFAIVSIILGGISMLTCWCCYGLPFNMLGIIFGIIALVQMSSDATQSGKGLAIGGICLSVASGVLAFVWVFASMFLMGMAESL